MSEQVQTNGLEDQAPSINDFQVTVNGEAFTLGQLASSATAAQLLYIAFQQQADQAQAEKKAAVQALQEEVNHLQNDNQAHAANEQKYIDDNRQLSAQVNELQFQLTDAISKRDAAGEALKEAQAEIARLNSHNDDLQKQIAVGVRGAIKIDAVAALEAYKKEEAEKLAARPAIYDVRKISSTKSTATLLETGEPIEFITNYIGQYRVIPDAEVETEQARFRAEQASQAAETPDEVGPADDHANSALVTPPPIEGESFQGHQVANEHPTAGLADAEPSVEVHGETFEEEVKRRLENLERAVYGKPQQEA